MMNIRVAVFEDINKLIRMRWDFTYELQPGIEADYAAFEAECRSFLEQAVMDNRWHIWVVEIEGTIVSHMYIQLIDKVPRPGRTTYPFAYLTNVYTHPDYRSAGFGSKLLQAIQAWAQEQHYEFIIVWPSDDSRQFYARNGYTLCDDPMELKL